MNLFLEERLFNYCSFDKVHHLPIKFESNEKNGMRESENGFLFVRFHCGRRIRFENILLVLCMQLISKLMIPVSEILLPSSVFSQINDFILLLLFLHEGMRHCTIIVDRPLNEPMFFNVHQIRIEFVAINKKELIEDTYTF